MIFFRCSGITFYIKVLVGGLKWVSVLVCNPQDLVDQTLSLSISGKYERWTNIDIARISYTALYLTPEVGLFQLDETVHKS